MSRPIQQLAPGFLGLLGLKNNGMLPPEFIDALQPVISMDRFYFLGGRETQSSAGLAVGAVSNFLFSEFVVPANEVWYVHGWNVQVSTAAASTWAGFAVHYTNNTLPIHSGLRDTATGGGIVQCPTIGDFLAAPGDRFGTLCQAVSGAGPFTAFGVLSYSRFPL